MKKGETEAKEREEERNAVKFVQKKEKVDWRLDSRQQRQTPGKASTLFMIKSIMPIQTVPPQIFEASGFCKLLKFEK